MLHDDNKVDTLSVPQYCSVVLRVLLTSRTGMPVHNPTGLVTTVKYPLGVGTLSTGSLHFGIYDLTS
jgi:hypothetical protein